VKKWRIPAVLLIVAVAIFGVVKIFGAREAGKAEEEYLFATVQRGDVRSVITSTGVLGAVETVEVGTQVSGIIAQVLVDFNDQVRRGQLLAVLDTAVLRLTVREAEASLAKAQANYLKAKLDLENAKDLIQKNLISKTDLDASQTTHDMAQADVLSAQSGFERAKTNLSHARIYSPIDGTILKRNVDAGQTVAASLSTPTLFMIAEDLRQMQILAYVDESDIGQIKDSMRVSFIVPAYPTEAFPGIVTQIRLQPETVSNVVNYIVVVNADNSSGKLLPGMTATVDFIREEARDVFLVPNAALRLEPSKEMEAMMPQDSRQAGQKPGAKSNGGRPDRQFSGMRPAGEKGQGRQPTNGSGIIWYLDDSGSLRMARVQLGITDGKQTEIKASEHISEGMEIIIGLSRNAEEKPAVNPQVQRQQRRLGLF